MHTHICTRLQVLIFLMKCIVCMRGLRYIPYYNNFRVLQVECSLFLLWPRTDAMLALCWNNDPPRDSLRTMTTTGWHFLTAAPLWIKWLSVFESSRVTWPQRGSADAKKAHTCSIGKCRAPRYKHELFSRRQRSVTFTFSERASRPPERCLGNPGQRYFTSLAIHWTPLIQHYYAVAHQWWWYMWVQRQWRINLDIYMVAGNARSRIVLCRLTYKCRAQNQLQKVQQPAAAAAKNTHDAHNESAW